MQSQTHKRSEGERVPDAAGRKAANLCEGFGAVKKSVEVVGAETGFVDGENDIERTYDNGVRTILDGDGEHIR